MKVDPATLVVLAVTLAAAMVIAWLILSFNHLVRLRNRVDEAWAQIDVQLRRRHDLITNLVEIVKGYASHERDTFERVTKARGAADVAQGPHDQAEAEFGLTQALRSLFAVAEDYPELQASHNFQELQTELTNTEDRISFTRQLFNTSVRRYETGRQVFPTNLVAGLFAFSGREYFDVDDPEVTDPVMVEF